MTDIILQHGGNYIKADLDGLKLTLTCSFDPKTHEVHTLRSRDSYELLKEELNGIYEDCGCTLDGFDMAVEELDTFSFHEKYFDEEYGRLYHDIRERSEIEEYLDEAWDKVRLMRNCCISKRFPAHEQSRTGMNRILNKYSDIPKDGYDDWGCGYWNGIMGALRWVLGDEKDFLDT